MAPTVLLVPEVQHLGAMRRDARDGADQKAVADAPLDDVRGLKASGAEEKPKGRGVQRFCLGSVRRFCSLLFCPPLLHQGLTPTYFSK